MSHLTNVLYSSWIQTFPLFALPPYGQVDKTYSAVDCSVRMYRSTLSVYDPLSDKTMLSLHLYCWWFLPDIQTKKNVPLHKSKILKWKVLWNPVCCKWLWFDRALKDPSALLKLSPSNNWDMQVRNWSLPLCIHRLQTLKNIYKTLSPRSIDLIPSVLISKLSLLKKRLLISPVYRKTILVPVICKQTTYSVFLLPAIAWAKNSYPPTM